MIESAGGMIPFLCHVFLILFGGFFGLNFAFNKNFAQNSFGFDNIQAAYMGRPLGFLMTGCIVMAIFALFGIAGVTSANEIFGAIFVFTVLAFLYNMAMVMKILPTYDGSDHHIKNAIRPLIPMLSLIHI